MLFKSGMKILELTQTIEKKDADIARLEEKLAKADSQISKLENSLIAFKAADYGTPAECHRGSWCTACEFSKALIFPGHGLLGNRTVFFCGKGESCSNFVQKEV